VNLPASSGNPLVFGRIKSRPADFIVQEELDFNFDGRGEHLYIYVRKCVLNTNDVIEILQRQFQCRSVDIGVSGLKDKYAITDQWFSIRTPLNLGDTKLPVVLQQASSSKLENNELAMTAGEYCVLESHRHTRKLRRGAHRHNRFVITVRDVVNANHSAPLHEAVDKRLHSLQVNGFANYFGPQRFGIDRQNLSAAERLFANPKRKMSRNKRSLLISAARSELFNCVCAERVKAGNWNLPLEGEPMLLDGSHSFFINDSSLGGYDSLKSVGTDGACADDTIVRCQRHDIHPSGPLWGEGDTHATGDCELFETQILQLYTILCQGVEHTGLKQQRRSLRANIERLYWRWQDRSIITLEFNLLKGVYATSFLSEFMVNLEG